MKFLKKILMKGEEEVFEGLAEHVSLSIKSMKIINDILSGSLSDKVIEASAVEVISYEKNGDKIADKLITLVMQGAMPVALAGDMGLLIDKVDDILDLIYFLALELARAYRVGVSRRSVVAEMYKKFTGMSLLATKALEALKEQFESVFKDYKKVQDLDSQIDVYEDKVDEFKNNILDEIYGLGTSVDPITFNHLVEIVRTLDTIVDSCEDASHILIRIMSSLAY